MKSPPPLELLDLDGLLDLGESHELDELEAILADLPSPTLPSPPRFEADFGDSQQNLLAAASPPRDKRPRKSSTQRQKEEMADLRKQVAELKARVECSVPGQQKPMSSRGGDKAKSVWGALASSQHEVKQRAIRENAKLRGEINIFKRDIGQFLQEAQRWSRLLRGSGYGSMDISPTLEDREILYRLVENVDVREFPDTFNTRAFSSDTESLWSTRIETNSAYSFELDGTSLIPFDQDTVNKVSWESTTNGKMHIGMRAIATIIRSEDNLGFQLIVDPSGKSDHGTAQIKSYLAIKRWRKGNRVMYTWESLSLFPDITASEIPALSLIQRGWSETVPCKLRSGRKGCMIQSYTKVSMNDMFDPQGSTHQGRVKLLQLFANSCAEGQGKINQLLENVLLDDAVSSSKRRKLAS